MAHQNSFSARRIVGRLTLVFIIMTAWVGPARAATYEVGPGKAFGSDRRRPVGIACSPATRCSFTGAPRPTRTSG